MSNSPFLSVVMPAYNEVPNFTSGVLNPTFSFLNKQKYSWEVIFVNDGSTDQTAELLEKFCKKKNNCHLVSIPHGGRAAAMIKGIDLARGKLILYTDFDQSTPIVEVEEFVSIINKTNCDIVIGSRGKSQHTKRVDNLFNKFRAEIFVYLARTLFALDYKDLNCGFKLYKNPVAKKIFSSLKVSVPKKIKGGFMGAIDSEILYLAKKYKFVVCESPVDWTRRPTHGSPWKEPLMVLIDLFKIKYIDISGGYK